MKLTPVEQERLWLFLAAELARKRRAAGLKLNHPESVALICDEVVEAARAGKSYDEAHRAGCEALSEEDVLDGVADMVDRIQVEGLFEDGTQLVTFYFPIKGRSRRAEMIPGETIHPDGDVEVNVGARTVELEVSNTLDRAIQVTSHFHFFEVNRALRFDREAALGMRLDVPAGMSVRFEPGETRTVRLRELGGSKLVRGFNRLVDGNAEDPEVRRAALERARERGFLP